MSSGALEKIVVEGDLAALADAITDVVNGHPPQLAVDALIAALSEVIQNCVAPHHQRELAEGIGAALAAGYPATQSQKAEMQ